ncbi:LamG-like jellyroll fold domain-containing protein [Streptosporangium amethystogenes]|uniref:LamG-like jellyroll fold domain-containing protein n=1 Tax=Streptosporangium amethystogenes TaxID=2002 RepID=UPI0037BD4FC2
MKKNGDWQSIDPTLIEENGVLRPKATKGDISLSLGGDTTAVAYSGEKGKGSVSVPGVLPKPAVKGNTATYPDAYGTGADLVISAHPEGFRHEIVLRQRPVEKLKLRIPLGLPKGLKLGKGSDKTPGVLDDQGKEIADLSSTLVLDATEMREPATGRMSQAETSVDGDGALVLKPDADFLADPAVTYPVTLAAPLEDWVGTGIAGDTFVSHSYPSSASNKGLNRIIVGRSNSGTVTWRGYIRFNIKGTPLEGGTVDNADLRLWNYDTNDCSDTATVGIVARRITTDWDINTMTWGSGQPSVVFDGQSGEKGAYGVNCPEGEGELWHTLEDITQAWMNGANDYGVQLSSASESVPTNWRWYRSDEYGGYDTYPFTPRGPVLIIKYEPKIKTEVRGYYVPGPSDGTTPTADEMTEHLTDQADAPDLPVLNEEQARALRENAQDTVISDATDGFYEVEEITREEWLERLDPDEEVHEPEPGGVPPVVVTTTPLAGATDIPVSTALHVTFDEWVANPAFVVKNAAGDVVSGETSVQGAQANFVPGQLLAEATTYTAEITAADMDGAAMTAPHSWSFTTGSATTPPQGLVAAYGLNEGSGTSVADSSGQHNTGTASATNWVNGKYGKALSFNGTSSWVTVEDAASLRLTTGMTLSAWVNPATVANWSSVVGKELSAGGVSYLLYAANGDSVPSGWAKVSTPGHATANGLSPLPVNTWSHLAFTYDGAALRLFVNGQQIADTPLSESLIDDGSPLHIGGNGIWGEYFSGLIDEVRVYNRAQSATEVQTDMNTPIGEQAPPDTQAPTAPGSLAVTGGPGNAQLTWTASTDNVGVGGYRIHRSTTPGFTPSAANQVGSSPTTTFTDAGLAVGTYYYRVRAVDAADNLSPSSNEVSATVTAPPTNPGLVAAYGMDEGSGTIVGDSSGKNNTGAATDTTWANGKHGKALSFNGTSSWVTVPHAESLRLTNALTLSAWVQPAANNNWRTVLMKELAEGGSYGLYSSNGSVPLGWLQTAESGEGVAGESALPLNQWSHLAVTYNGSTATLYVNGTLLNQEPITGDLIDDGGVLRLGGNNAWREFFNGRIDEVRIYNRVQTATEIQTDMNTPVGAAPAGVAAQQRRMDATADAAPTIDKLTIEGARTVDGITVASTLTPGLTTWLSAGRDGEAKVEVELADTPTKSFKAGRVITDKRLLWSGQVTAKPGDSRVTLQIPKGKLQDGEKVRWRARVADSDTGGWTYWQNLIIQQPQSAQPPAKEEPVDGSLPNREPEAKQKATRAGASTASLAETMSPLTGTQAVQAAVKPFNYDRIDKQGDCQLSRHQSIATWRWIKNSFNVCFTGRIGETETVNDISNGIAWSARFSMVVHTYVGHSAGTANPTAARGEAGIHSRQMKAWIKVDDFRPGGFEGAAGRPVKVGLSNSGGCFVDKKIIVDDIGDWIQGADRLITITSPEAWFPAPDRKGFCGLRPSVSYPESDNPLKLFGWLSPDRVEFRCDSSPRILNHTGGCVVWSARPVWHLDGNRAEDPVTKSGVNQTAAHIWKALYDPDDTVPLSPVRKKIPGRYSKNDPGCMSENNRCLTRAEGDRKDPDTVPGKNDAARKKCAN